MSALYDKGSPDLFGLTHNEHHAARNPDFNGHYRMFRVLRHNVERHILATPSRWIYICQWRTSFNLFLYDP